jgi:anti-anti-sigma factor
MAPYRVPQPSSSIFTARSSTFGSSCEVTHVGRCVLVALRGEFDGTSALITRNVLAQQWIPFPAYSVVLVNLSQVGFMSLAGLRLLQWINDRCRESGGVLLIVRPSRPVRRLLAVTTAATHRSAHRLNDSLGNLPEPRQAASGMPNRHHTSLAP